MGSIFEQAGEEYRKKAKGETPAEPPKPALTPARNLTPEEVRKLFEDVYKLSDTVAKKLDEAYKLMGMRHEEIKSFLDNPSNFKDAAEWQRIQHARENMLGKVEKSILYGENEPPKEAKANKKKKAEDLADKKRKGKTLGSRKGWISM